MSDVLEADPMTCEPQRQSLPSRSMASCDRFGVTWAGRTVLIVGLGKSGVAAANLLQRLGCRVRLSDLRESESLRQLAARLRETGVEQVEVGYHSQRLLEGAEMVVTSPGVPESAPPIRWAQERGVPVISEIELAFRFCPAPIVAVTGTNGKSSVVTVLQQILHAAGRHPVACGNLGIPFTEVVSTMNTTTIAVVEVSSFQLLGCDQFRPAIAVLLNLGVNHLDRHPDRDSYLAAKARLFQRQTPSDVAVLNAGDPAVASMGQHLCAQRIWFGAGAMNPPAFRLDPHTCRLLPDNLQAALQMARLLGIPDPLSYQVIREFRGLEHRLEYVTTLQGVRVVNDSKSTTPDSLLYAIAQCPGSVVPIIGGRDKGLDFRPLATACAQERIRGVVLIGESRAQLRAILNGSTTTRECETLDAAVEAARELTHPGDTILFSPGCASFDMFRNFEERGAAFKSVVRHLLNGRSNGHPQVAQGKPRP